MTKKAFLKQVAERADTLTDENYHEEASILYNIERVVRSASEDTWKDVALDFILNIGDL